MKHNPPPQKKILPAYYGSCMLRAIFFSGIIITLKLFPMNDFPMSKIITHCPFNIADDEGIAELELVGARVHGLQDLQLVQLLLVVARRGGRRRVLSL